jgi:hypothetical protein
LSSTKCHLGKKKLHGKVVFSLFAILPKSYHSILWRDSISRPQAETLPLDHAARACM